MKIFGVLADRSGCGWYRMIQPFAELARQHPEHLLYLDESMPQSVDGLDVLVGQRVCLPGPSATFQRHAREGRVKTVLELDDDLWCIDPSNGPAHAFFRPELLDNLRRNVEVADLVTTTTDVLAERLGAWNPNVCVLPNMVPAWLLEHERPAASDRVTIGWAGGLSHSRDWGEINAPLRRLIQHPSYRDRVELHTIGADWTGRVRTPRSAVRHTGWIESCSDLYRATDFDIGLAPLRPSPFNDAKSDIKLLEYAALGIPAIVSDVGPYARAHHGFGDPKWMLAGPRDWAEKLRYLIDDAEYREQLGKAAREWAGARTIERNAWRWEAAYR